MQPFVLGPDDGIIELPAVLVVLPLNVWALIAPNVNSITITNVAKFVNDLLFMSIEFLINMVNDKIMQMTIAVHLLSRYTAQPTER